MPKKVFERLSDRKASSKLKPGYHIDGQGLYLQVTTAGTKSWILRYMLAGRAREMGMGGYPDKTLADARHEARRWRALVSEGRDPIEERRRVYEDNLAQSRAERAKKITFAEAASRYIDANLSQWRNAKHVAQWRSTIETYANPLIGNLAVDAIDTKLVEKVLDPIWRTKTETATRLRGRIESVLDWATVRGYRSGDNPARWKGHLAKLLPRPTKVAKVSHHAALPFSEMGAFMAKLRDQIGIAARALEFAVLTACRTGEVIGARWGEIDLKAKTWIIPPGRMKAHKEHRVPLSPAVLHLLKHLPREGENPEFVFLGAREGRHLSNLAMLQCLKRMGWTDLTVHGFRSSFRDWAAERTNHPREVVEEALGHTLESKVEAAYRRGDLFDKRAKLMSAWATYCGNVGKDGVIRG